MSETGHTDYSKHTDEELREGIEKADRELERVAAEDSDAASQANREQRDRMKEELERRQPGDAASPASAAGGDLP